MTQQSTTHVLQLGVRIEQLKSEGVIDIKAMPYPGADKEQIAKSILDLMDASIVDDPDMF